MGDLRLGTGLARKTYKTFADIFFKIVNLLATKPVALASAERNPGSSSSKDS